MNNKDKAETVLRSGGYDLLILGTMTDDEVDALADCFIPNAIGGGHRYSIDRATLNHKMALRTKRLDEAKAAEAKAAEEIEDLNQESM